MIVIIDDGYGAVQPVPPGWQQCFEDVDVEDEFDEIEHDDLPGMEDMLDDLVEDAILDLEQQVVAVTESGSEAQSQVGAVPPEVGVPGAVGLSPEIVQQNIQDAVDQLVNEIREEQDRVRDGPRPQTGDILVFQNVQYGNAVQRKNDAWDETDEVSKGGELNIVGHKEATEPWSDNFLQLPSSTELLSAFQPEEKGFFAEVIEALAPRKRHLLITTVSYSKTPFITIYNPTDKEEHLENYIVLYAEKLPNNKLKRIWSSRLPSAVLKPEDESVVAIRSARKFEKAYGELPDSVAARTSDDSRVPATTELNGVPQVTKDGVVALVFWESREEVPVAEISLTGAQVADLPKQAVGGAVEKPAPDRKILPVGKPIEKKPRPVDGPLPADVVNGKSF
ncbi:MAG: hypothetical protein L0287_34430, partial [Anaerolineae bacterium]|nr:hypothetical protein [Anaerolineae bacterium]